MNKQLRQSVNAMGQRKTYGALKQIKVPSFGQFGQGLVGQGEVSQAAEITEENVGGRAARQMKQFSIRKSVHQPSFSIDNKPKDVPSSDVKVMNPWIYEQESGRKFQNSSIDHRFPPVPGSIAALKSPKDVASLPKDGTKQLLQEQRDAEGRMLLEAEYAIFNDPNLPGGKELRRYDTTEEDVPIEERLQYCQARPGQAHGLSPVFQANEYVWTPVEVLNYDSNYDKFIVKVVTTGQEKFVARLSLLFFNEDSEKFKRRVNLCKERQQNVQAELRFTKYVDSIPTESVSTLSKERQISILRKTVRQSDKFISDQS